MVRKLVLVAALAALVVPVAALAATPNGHDRANAARDCKALRASLGADTFRDTYKTAHAAGRNAFGKCVSKWSHTEAANRVNAARSCRAERAGDPAAFAAAYGAHGFGKCVSKNRRAAARAERHATVNAAKTCKAQRADDPDGFSAQWGTGRNAYGRCVSHTAKAQL